MQLSAGLAVLPLQYSREVSIEGCDKGVLRLMQGHTSAFVGFLNDSQVVAALNLGDVDNILTCRGSICKLSVLGDEDKRVLQEEITKVFLTESQLR